MKLKIQILATITFSLFLVACTEDRNFDTDTKTVDIRLDNVEEITLEVIQSSFLTHLYLPIFEFLGEMDLPAEAVQIENTNMPELLAGELISCDDFPILSDDELLLLEGSSATKFYCSDSSVGADGVALYTVPADNEYAAGNRVEVEYERFVNDLGWIQNGRISSKYTKTDGLNRHFSESDTVSCLVNLQSDISSRTKINETALLAELINAPDGALISETVINDVPLLTVLPDRDGASLVSDTRLTSKELNTLFTISDLDGESLNGVMVYDVVGDGVRFINLAHAIQIEVYGRVQKFNDDGSPVLEDGNPTFEILTDGFGSPILDSDDQEIYVQEVLDVYTVNNNDKVIVINHSSETTDNQIASINKDQIFTVLDLETEEVNCQAYERELSASLTNLSVLKDNITYSINGSMHIIEGTINNDRFAREVRDSSFKTTVSQENREEVYTMADFSISYSQGVEFGSYTFDTVLGGSISSSAFPGKLEVSQTDILTGQDGTDRPTSGQFNFLGQGLERVSAIFREFTIFLSVDYDGDSTGNQRSDVDFRFEPTWDDLLNRDFVQPEAL